jgi:hypothetical protein
MPKTKLSMTRRGLLFVCALALAACVVGCGGTGGDTAVNSKPGGAGATAGGSQSGAYPGTDAGAEALLKEFLKPGADHAALTRQLRPTKADYDTIFQSELAAKADSVYTPAWDGGQMVVAPKPNQTELKLFSASTDELKSWTGAAADFPEGYKQVAEQLKPGVKVYRFKFVEPGQDLGMAFDGLAYINGHWRIFPKPWRLQG